MIDRSIEGNAPRLEEVDFEKIAQILDAAETALLAAASEHHLHGVKLERWRWDRPEILMSWSPSRQIPQIGKNIRVLVKPEGAGFFSCAFESNAWYDARWDPSSFTRYWAHFPGGTIPISSPEVTLHAESRWMRKYVESAYEQVSDSGRVLLNRAMLISSDGDAQKVDGAVVISGGTIEPAGRAAGESL